MSFGAEDVLDDEDAELLADVFAGVELAVLFAAGGVVPIEPDIEQPAVNESAVMMDKVAAKVNFFTNFSKRSELGRAVI